MKKYTKSNPVFYEEIMITEPTDPGHADNINAAPKQIFENTLVNKKEIEEGDSQNRTVTFTSGDGDTDTADQWKDVPKIVSGEKHKSLFEKVSTMFRNVRYLYNLLGSEDISQLGDGTVTGIVAALKQAAFLNPTNNLLATIAGTSLDAVQGSVLKNGQDDLQKQITQINSDLSGRQPFDIVLKRNYDYKTASGWKNLLQWHDNNVRIGYLLENISNGKVTLYLTNEHGDIRINNNSIEEIVNKLALLYGNTSANCSINPNDLSTGIYQYYNHFFATSPFNVAHIIVSFNAQSFKLQIGACINGGLKYRTRGSMQNEWYEWIDIIS